LLSIMSMAVFLAVRTLAMRTIHLVVFLKDNEALHF